MQKVIHSQWKILSDKVKEYESKLYTKGKSVSEKNKLFPQMSQPQESIPTLSANRTEWQLRNLIWDLRTVKEKQARFAEIIPSHKDGRCFNMLTKGGIAL